MRGFSFFGVSFVYVIFEDGTDIYWARSRVLEYLNSATAKLPAGIKPALGPDATGVGWVYQYVVVGANRTLAELRSLQDWYIRFGLAKAARRRRGGERRRLRAAIQRRGRSGEAPQLRRAAVARGRCDPRLQPRDRRPRGRDGRGRVHGARPRLPHRHRRPRADRAQGRRADAGADARRGADRARAGRTARPQRARRRRRGGGRHRPAALRPERARRHRQRQGQAARHRRRPARGGADRDRLRPLGTDPSRHRHAEIDPDRGEPGRRGGVHRVPAACALGAGRHRHLAGRRAHGLHRHARRWASAPTS